MNTVLRRMTLLGCLVLAGCGGIADRVRDRVPVEVAPERHSFAADARTTYAAALTVARAMGFRYTHGGPAQGRLEAISRVTAGEGAGSARQLTLTARFSPSLDGRTTEVSLGLTEILEEDSARRQGEGTETALRNPALARTFFRAVEQQLANQSP